MHEVCVDTNKLSIPTCFDFFPVKKLKIWPPKNRWPLKQKLYTKKGLWAKLKKKTQEN